MKYESEIIAEILEKRGHKKSSLHYKSECIETWIEETKGAYPKLCDYESEWLNYINENPIGEFPYETITDVTEATINNVVPYAYKSAILKGQTLMNLAPKSNNVVIENYTDGNVALTNEITPIQHLKSGVTYTIFFKVKNLSSPKTSNIMYQGRNDDKVFYKYTAVSGYQLKDGWNKITLVIEPSLSPKTIQLTSFLCFETGGGATIMGDSIMILEGDYINVDIPYFEGMQSVKLPVLKTVGKNLFDVTKHIELKVNNDGSYSTIGTPASKYDVLYQLEPNTDYILSFDKFGDSMCWVGCRINGIFSNNSGGDLRKKITTDSSGLVTISFGANSANDIGHTITNIQLEKSSMYTSYEPYKSNILTVNEDVTLRSNGDICDELNLLTGQLTQRIGEDGVVLSQEVVKTVDLTITNQDGETLTKLTPFEGTMHISTNGTPIKPTVSMEIPVEAIIQNLASFIEEE